MSRAFSDTKPHYEILDALRGVAALMVVWYHICEGYSFAGQAPIIQGLNHGYLAVDFFFILSGFVLSYAYDDRWEKDFTVKKFFRRRLIRLHPMVIMGALIGAAAFLVQGSVQWNGTNIALSAVMLALLCAMFMIPAVPGCAYEVRGNGEMFPLNGPSWSLFFEYIGNILYALLIRRLPDKALVVLCAVLGIALGDLSYPLYITHYPVMYLFYSWMIRSGQYTFASTWAQSIMVYAACLVLAALCLKFYDTQLRSRLTRSKK